MLYYFQYTAEEEAGTWIDKAIAIESSIFSFLVGLRTLYISFTTYTVGKVIYMHIHSAGHIHAHSHCCSSPVEYF
jgi:hypothetical protein